MYYSKAFLQKFIVNVQKNNVFLKAKTHTAVNFPLENNLIYYTPKLLDITGARL